MRSLSCSCQVEQLLQSKAPEIQLKLEREEHAMTSLTLGDTERQMAAEASSFSPRSSEQSVYASGAGDTSVSDGVASTQSVTATTDGAMAAFSPVHRQQAVDLSHDGASSERHDAFDSSWFKFLANTSAAADVGDDRNATKRAFSSPADGSITVDTDVGFMPRRNTVDDMHGSHAPVQSQLTQDIQQLTAALQLPQVSAGKDFSLGNTAVDTSLLTAAMNMSNPALAKTLALQRSGQSGLLTASQSQQLAAAASQAGLMVRSPLTYSPSMHHPIQAGPAVCTAMNSPGAQQLSPPLSAGSDVSGTHPDAASIRERVIAGSGFLMNKADFADQFRNTGLPVDQQLPDTDVFAPSSRRERSFSGPSGNSPRKAPKRKISGVLSVLLHSNEPIASLTL